MPPLLPQVLDCLVLQCSRYDPRPDGVLALEEVALLLTAVSLLPLSAATTTDQVVTTIQALTTIQLV